MPTIIYSRTSEGDGLRVSVTADWPKGQFTVIFQDTDADKEITRRVYSNPDAAVWYANKLIPGFSYA